MSFEAPTFDRIRGEYVATFTHTNGQQIVVKSLLTAGPETLDPVGMDEAWTAAVDLLATDPDLTLAFASKSYATVEIYAVEDA